MNRISLVLIVIIFASSFNFVWAGEGSGELTCRFYSDSNVSIGNGELVLFTEIPDYPASYEHHSCSHDNCMEDCELGYFDKLGISYAAELPSKMLDSLSSCLCKQGNCVASDQLKKVYEGVKTGKCALTCTVNIAAAKDDMEKVRAKAECFRCQLAGGAGKIPGGSCVVGLYNELGDLLVPHSDCLSECLGKPQTWDNNRGHPCRDAITPDRFACLNTPKGSFVVEETCKDCQWSNEKFDENLGENVLNIKKWCPSGTTCTVGSDGRPTCKPPDPKKPKHPGGDKPDDNFDVSSLFIKALQSNASDYDYLRNATADIAILDRGFPSLIMNSLLELNETANFITVEYLPFLDPIDYPLLIIPTGGLYSMDSSSSFKTGLWDYVDKGGNLIVFTQQHGYEFNAIPGNNITAYGWMEDQSCQFASVEISTYNPLFAGFETTRLNVNVDGFFTSYPENGSVLLTRTKNGMPAMIMYRYGKGTVLASTLYSDMAVALHQGSKDEDKLIRDIITWGRKGMETETYPPGIVDFSMNISNPFYGPLSYPLPEYQSGDRINLPINVTNYEPNVTDKISFVLIDPYFNFTWANITEILTGYESKFVNLTYNTGPTNMSGIWTILYILYNGSQEISWGFGGEFGLNYSIDYMSNYTAIVTIRDPEKNKIGEERSNLTILPNRMEPLYYSFNSSNNSSQKGMWSARYSVLDMKGTVLSSGTYPFAISDFKENEGGYTYQGSDYALTVTSDDEWYPYGSPARFTFHLWNYDVEARNITVTWGLAHHLGIWSNAYHRSIVVNASSNATFEYILPRVIDLDRLRAILYVEGGFSGTADKGIRMFKPDIKTDVLTDNNYYLRGKNVTISYNISNLRGEIYSRCSGPGNYIGIPGAVKGCSLYLRPLPVNNSIVLIKVIDPDNSLIFQNLSFFDFPPGYVGNGTYEVQLPGNAKPGLYTVAVETSQYGYKIGYNSSFFEVKNVPLELEFNKSWYRIRETIGFEIFLNNILPFPWNQTINVNIPGLGFSDERNIQLESGENISLVFSAYLPPNLSEGTHQVSVKKIEENTDRIFSFTIPGSKLNYKLLQSSVSHGDNISIEIENTGGLDTTYNYSSILQDPYINTILSHNEIGTIEAGESIIINHTLHEGAINGSYFLRIELENLVTSKKLKSIELFSVNGLRASLDIITDKKVYSPGENISILTNISSLSGIINGAILNLSILSRELPQLPQKPCVVPSDNLLINEDTTLCPGIYNIPDPDKNGVIIINAPGITLEGSGTVIIGSETYYGRGIYNLNHDNVIIKNLEVRDYYFGMMIQNSENCTLENNTATGNSYAGIYLAYSHNAIVRNNNMSFNTWDGLGLESENSLVENNYIFHNNYGVRFYSDSVSHIVRNNQINSNGMDGIYIADPSPYNYNITILNNSISRNSESGIYLYGSQDNIFLNNSIDNNGDYGIYLLQGKNNTFIGNSISGSPCNFYLYAYWMDEYYQNLYDNTVNEKPLYFLNGASNQVIDSAIDPGMVWIVDSFNITVKDVILTNNSHGILFVNTNSSTIENANASNMLEAGIDLQFSHNNLIRGANANKNVNGISIVSSGNTTLINNYAGSNSYWGFKIWRVRGAKVIENKAESNVNGGGISVICSSESPRSIISNNTLKSNKGKGIEVLTCSELIMSSNLLTGNLPNGLTLSNSNNCKIINNTVFSNSGSGATLSGLSNLLMKNNTITGNQNGMYIQSNTLYSTFESNVIGSNNYNGLIISGSHYNSFKNNSISNNKNYGLQVSGSHGNFFENNTINSNRNPNWWSVDGTAIYLSQSDNNTFRNNNASQNYDGIELINSANNSFADNSVLRNEYNGILVDYSRRNSFINNSINRNGDKGVYIKGFSNLNSTDNRFINNSISNSGYGIYLAYGNNNFFGNEISGSSCNLYFEGSSIPEYNQTFDIHNTVDGKPVYYFNGIKDQIIDSSINPGFIGVVNSNNVTIMDLNLTNQKNSHGLILYNSSNSIIENVNVSNTCRDGILILSSPNSNISNSNSSSNPRHGFYISNSNGNRIIDNFAFYNTEHGIYLDGIQDSFVSDNFAFRTKKSGIQLKSSHNNTVSNNIVTFQELYKGNTGIGLETSESNILINNSLYLNQQAITIVTSSHWNSIKNNNLSNNYNGIQIGGFSHNNHLENNIANGNTVYGWGFHIGDSSNNTLKNNAANSNGYGFSLLGGTNNTFINNIANSNNWGFYNEYSKDSNFINNTANSNKYDGIYLLGGWWEDYFLNNSLKGNILCSNLGTDISNNSNNKMVVGSENTCNIVNNWNDTGTTGCTYNCSGIAITSLSSLPIYTPTGYIYSGTSGEILTESSPRENMLPERHDKSPYSVSLSNAIPDIIESTKIQRDEIQTSISKIMDEIPGATIRDSILSYMGLFSKIIENIPHAISLVAAEGGEFIISSAGFNHPPMITISSNGGDSNGESYNIWNESTTVNVDGTLEINTNVSGLDVTGKLYLYAELFSPSGQLLAFGIYPFYISDDELALVMDSDKNIYKAGQIVNISGYVENSGNSSQNLEFNITVDGSIIYNTTTLLNPYSKYPFNKIILAPNSSFVLEGKVDGINVTENIFVEVPAINASINAPQIAGLDEFEIEVSIENPGNVSADLNISGINKTWNLSIPIGGIGFLKDNMSIMENTTVVFEISGDASWTDTRFIEFGEKSILILSTQQTYAEGIVEIEYDIINQGILDSKFNASFRINDQSKNKEIYIPVGANLTEILYFNLTKGSHILNCTSPFWNESFEINVEGRPEFQMTLPGNLTFALGQEVNLSIPVKNIGGKEGEANLHVQSPGLFDEFNSSWIEGGDEINITIPLTIPDDVEEKKYSMFIDINGKKYSSSFIVQGAKIDVNAYLDKMSYEEGENATLTVDIVNLNSIDLETFARIQFNGYENQTYFNLSGYGSKDLLFSVPIQFKGDNKMLYSIYMVSGRSVYINSIYVYEKEAADAGITVYTDKQVYEIGENVTININTTQVGVLNLSAPKFQYNDNISANDSFQLVFTVPELLSGTHYIEYSYNNYDFSYPFDVDGYYARILELVLDKDNYKSGDNFTLYGNVEVNKDVNASLNITILDYNSTVIDGFSINQSLYSGENIFSYTGILPEYLSGMYSIVPDIIIDISGYSPVSIVSAAKYFDIAPKFITINVSVSSGWNMVSFPLNETSLAIPDAVLPYAYTYNPLNQTYEIIGLDDMKPGQGFWLAAVNNSNFTVTGIPLTAYKTNVFQGWNMIGSIFTDFDTNNLKTVPPNSVLPYVYWYNPNNGTYEITTRLNPNNGYWCAAINNSELSVGD